jgi:hypothetical protein
VRINDAKYLGSPADVGRGFWMGAALGALFGIRELIGGLRQIARPLEPSRGNAWLIAAVMLLGGCLAGAIAGAFRPLVRRLPVALVLGFVAVFPVMLVLDAIRNHVTYPPGEMEWGIDAASAVIIGSIGVLAFRSAAPSDRSA